MLVQASDWLIKFIFVAVSVAFGLIMWWAINKPLTTRCLQCKSKKALEKTGATRGSGWFKGGQVEWRCKFCGYCRWDDKYHNYGDF